MATAPETSKTAQDKRGGKHARRAVENRRGDLLVAATVVQGGECAPEVAADDIRAGAERVRGGFVYRGYGTVRKYTHDPGTECAENVDPGGGQQRLVVRGAVYPLRLHLRPVQCSPFLLRHRRRFPDRSRARRA